MTEGNCMGRGMVIVLMSSVVDNVFEPSLSQTQRVLNSVFVASRLSTQHYQDSVFECSEMSTHRLLCHWASIINEFVVLV
jgi:hypothetical protein